MVDVPKRRIRIVMAHSAMECRCAGLADDAAGGAGLVVVVAMDQPEGAFPTSLGEEVLGEIQEMARQIIDGRTGQAFGAGVVGPINNQRLADDISAGNESPVAAVERIIAIVAHGEE